MIHKYSQHLPRAFGHLHDLFNSYVILLVRDMQLGVVAFPVIFVVESKRNMHKRVPYVTANIDCQSLNLTYTDIRNYSIDLR